MKKSCPTQPNQTMGLGNERFVSNVSNCWSKIVPNEGLYVSGRNSAWLAIDLSSHYDFSDVALRP